VTDPTPAPRALTVQAGGDRLAVVDERPRLSWQDDAPLGAVYVVEVEVDAGTPARAEVTGRRMTDWPFAPLKSSQQVRWRVRRADAVGWSDWAAFEAGLFDADWTAEWISPIEGADAGYGDRPAHTLSRTFDLPGGVAAARLYATALGVYTTSLNGARVGTDELAPGSTSYDRTLYAQAYDVTGDLVAGPNRIELTLSDGWYRGQVGAFRLPAGWGTETGVRAELHVFLGDGTREVIRTDGEWTARRSPIVRADLMAGETVDFHAPVEPEVPVHVADLDAPPISWSPAPPVRVVETRGPVASTQIADDVWVIDFGQNASGWVTMTDLGDAGTRTVIDYGEYVDPATGDLSTAHLDSERPEGRKEFVQRDEVIAGADGEVFEPRHTVHGFQYARVTRSDASFDPASIAMRVVHTDLVRTGTFESSDTDLNRLHEIAEWSFRGNAVDVPTDCPTRERLAWTGDYQVFAPTATRLYDVLGFTRKWLQSVRDDQLDDGRIANFSPDGRRIKHHLDDQFAMMTGSSGWGDAIVAVPWEMYAAYGDREILAENYDAMTRWVAWASEQAASKRHHARAQSSPEPAPYEKYLWDGTFHWGEWSEPRERDADGNRIDPIKHNPMAWFMADKGEVGTAYLYRSTATLGRIAAILGHEDAAAAHAARAEAIRGAWQTAYLREDGRTVGDAQAAYVRALSFDLIPEALRPAAVARLVELIEGAGMHLGTGFLATGDLLPVLADAGRADIAYALLSQRTAPSWLYMLDRGATTIWEDWEGIDENGVAHESLNHYSKGAVIRFLHTHTLGLRQQPGSTAWEDIVIAPVPAPNMSWARGLHDGPQGAIAVEWRREGEAMRIIADVPAGTRAQIVFPTGETVEVGPGRFDQTSSTSK